jgi:hypothetical protein
MNMADIRKAAKDLDIRSFGKTKVALVREIQTKQGNFDCFAKVKDYCDQLDCRFREACFKEAAKLKQNRKKTLRSTGEK